MRLQPGDCCSRAADLPSPFCSEYLLMLVPPSQEEEK